MERRFARARCRDGAGYTSAQIVDSAMAVSLAQEQRLIHVLLR
jgi:hypothetical protein